MDSLMSLEPVHSIRHLRDLHKLFDSAETNIRSLHALSIEPDAYGSLLSPILLAKLPPDLRLIVNREVANLGLTMEALLKTFKSELTASKKANPSQLPTGKRTLSYDKTTPPTASALLLSARETKIGPCCSFCQQDHTYSSCPTVVHVPARKSILRSNGRCFNWLWRGHICHTCKSSSRCQKCKRRQHTFICENSSKQGKTPSLTNSSFSPDAPQFQPGQTTTNVCSTHSQAVFLQTAIVVIQNPNCTKISVEVRLLFDGRSQRSYLSE